MYFIQISELAIPIVVEGLDLLIPDTVIKRTIVARGEGYGI
jgi:hypothetical protein